MVQSILLSWQVTRFMGQWQYVTVLLVKLEAKRLAYMVGCFMAFVNLQCKSSLSPSGTLS